MGGHRSYHHQTSTRERALSRSLKIQIQIRASVGSRTGDDDFPLCWWICSIFITILYPIFIFFGCGLRVCFNRWIREPGCFIQSRSSWWVSSVYALSSDLESWFTPSIKVRCGKPFLLRKNKSWTLRELRVQPLFSNALNRSQQRFWISIMSFLLCSNKIGRTGC